MDFVRAIITRGLVCFWSLCLLTSSVQAAEITMQERITSLFDALVEGGHLVNPVGEDGRPVAEAAESGPEELIRTAIYASRLDRAEPLAVAHAALKQAADTRNDEELQALARIFAARLQGLRGNLEQSQILLRQISNTPLAQSFWRVEVLARYQIAHTASLLDQTHSATESLSRAFGKLPQGSDTLSPINVELHTLLGSIDARLRDLPSAVSQFMQSVSIADRAGVRADGARILLDIAETLMLEERNALARALIERFESAAATVGDSRAQFMAQYAFMKLEHNLGNAGKSSMHADTAMELYRPAPPTAAMVQQYQFFNSVDMNDLSGARRHMEAAEQLVESWPALSGTEISTYNILLQSRLAELENRLADALSAYKRYSEVRRLQTLRTFAEDMSRLRADLEQQLAIAQAERSLAEREKSLASERLRIQRSLLIVAAILAVLGVAGYVYQRRLTRALDDSRRLAESANAAKSSFLANISHELRTPLNAIIGFSQMSAREMLGPIGNERYRQYAESIERAGRHLLSVINDILDISRVEAGRLDLEEEDVNLARAFRDVLEMIEFRAREKSVTVTHSGLASLPDVRGDGRLLRQMLANLLTNAVKFTEPGGTVRMEAEIRDSGDIELSVIDNGVGMDEDEIKLALEPFGQVESVFTREHDGTGLGLPLVKTFAESHGGRLELTSRKGLGTRATVCLPAHRVIPKADPERPVALGA